MTNFRAITETTETKPRFRLPEPPQREPDEMTSYDHLHKLGNSLHLSRHFGNEDTTLVAAERWITKAPGDRTVSLRRPDLLVAFDVSPQDYEDSNGYVISEQGKPPDFVLEIASPSTAEIDTGPKRRDYAALGIPEYWRFDHEGKDHGTRLAGDRLTGEHYTPIPIAELPGGILQGYSAALNLILRWNNGRLEWIDPATGEHIATFDALREQAEQEREGRLRERERADRAEALLREAEEEIRRLREQ